MKFLYINSTPANYSRRGEYVTDAGTIYAINQHAHQREVRYQGRVRRGQALVPTGWKGSPVPIPPNPSTSTSSGILANDAVTTRRKSRNPRTKTLTMKTTTWKSKPKKRKRTSIRPVLSSSQTLQPEFSSSTIRDRRWGWRVDPFDCLPLRSSNVVSIALDHCASHPLRCPPSQTLSMVAFVGRGRERVCVCLSETDIYGL